MIGSKMQSVCSLAVVGGLIMAFGCAGGDPQQARIPEPAEVAKTPPERNDPLPTITNSIGMQLVQIPSGEFLMGSPDSDGDAEDHEKPQHRVRITEAFYLGVYPVTQEEYQQVMGSNPSHFTGDPRLPVEMVSWEDAVEFCNQLSALPEEQAAGRFYRLPTEAEWEYACRAGSRTVYSFGDSAESLGDYAWYLGNSGRKTHPVGQKKPNAWGLYDMHGNVLEWCSDRFGHRYYADSPLEDPTGPASATDPVRRGGSWIDGAGSCRAACRHAGGPWFRSGDMGFRVAAVPLSQSSQEPASPAAEPGA